ncbi:MAG: cation-transporting P-type ATPase [Chloroflexi bacterium]|nr:cation-transporting P-type ATPase [Chloroflexota bacterium]
MNRIDAPDRIATVHTLPVGQVYEALASDPQGLSTTEAARRLLQYGPNALREEKGVPLYRRFLGNFTHLMALLIWVAGIAAIFAQMPQLAIAVWMVNVINGAFSFWQEFRAGKAIEALRNMLPAYARVLRDAHEQRILASELVPGDVILLAEGDRISADARIVQESELRVDQSTLTGESHPVNKLADAVLRADLSRSELPDLIFAGTNVAAGTAKAVVFATGMETEFGKIAHLTQALGEELSPLQREIVSVTKTVTVIAVAMGVIFFILAVALAGMDLAKGFIFGLGMIVAFVPEGLLPTVTLALAMGVQRMAKRHALIKKLSAVETLGCTTVICTDKTGTLTQNEMTVRQIWLGGQSLAVAGVGYAPEGEIRDESGRAAAVPAQGDLRELLLAGGLCNNSRLLPPDGDSDRWTVLGDPTEAALKVVAAKAGLDLDGVAAQSACLREIPFESRRKRMTSIRQAEGGPIAYVKGAPREVLALCTRARLAGADAPLDEALRARITQANDDYARNGLRVLAMAARRLDDSCDLGGSLSACSSDLVERDLTFLGLMAMMDPPRPEVAEAVGKCHQAGIRIIMITGDYGLTAESIARRVGIVRGERPRIVTGVELETMDGAALKAALQDEVIFARVAPEHKLRVVTALQELGHVVAVTGDGVNDAPALKKADIGVAMGIGGTDVAKEAANMILTDDNFASIVNAVEEGRAVYANIKKFTTYIFTSNAPEAVPFVLYAFTAGRIPLALNVMHILAIDLGTDIVPALALGAEPPEPGVMAAPPRNLKDHLITRSLLVRAYLILGAVQSVAAMAAFYFLYWTNGYAGQWIDLPDTGWIYRAATAMALAAVVATQIGNLFAQRSEKLSAFRLPLFNNRFLWLGILSELVVVALIVYVPPFQRFIGTAGFPLKYWLFLFAWTPSLLLVDELRKALVQWRERSRGANRRSS